MCRSLDSTWNIKLLQKHEAIQHIENAQVFSKLLEEFAFIIHQLRPDIQIEIINQLAESTRNIL